MKVDNNFVFTDAAEQAAHAAGMKSFSFSTDPQAPGLLAGDLLQLGTDERAPVFLVVNRMFMWKSPQHLVVQILLDLAPGQ